jgi:hypothetical protein
LRLNDHHLLKKIILWCGLFFICKLKSGTRTMYNVRYGTNMDLHAGQPEAS